MLKLEIKLDESKIKSEHKYDANSIYRTLEKSFLKHDIPMIQECDTSFSWRRPSERLWCFWRNHPSAERKRLVYGLCNKMDVV